jgi:hypothetical protein
VLGVSKYYWRRWWGLALLDVRCLYHLRFWGTSRRLVDDGKLYDTVWRNTMLARYCVPPSLLMRSCSITSRNRRQWHFPLCYRRMTEGPRNRMTLWWERGASSIVASNPRIRFFFHNNTELLAPRLRASVLTRLTCRAHIPMVATS